MKPRDAFMGLLKHAIWNWRDCMAEALACHIAAPILRMERRGDLDVDAAAALVVMVADWERTWRRGQ